MIPAVVICSALLGLLLTGSPGAFTEFLLLLVPGILVIIAAAGRENRGDSLRIFCITMSCYFIYACICHAYRISEGFVGIGSSDGIGYFLPHTLKLLDKHGLGEVLAEIWGDERSPMRHGGNIFVYFHFIARLADMAKFDHLFAMQLSLMPFAALICVVEYHILRKFEIPPAESFKWSLGFGLGSALFWLSSFVVRDLPIHLAYAIAIYMMFSSTARWKKMLIGAAVFFMAFTLRKASGIGLLPILLLAVCREKDSYDINKATMAFFIILGLVSGIDGYIKDQIERTTTDYMRIEMMDQEGKSLLAGINILPFGLSHIVKTLYAQLHPIPVWRNMSASDEVMQYAYNITKFPDLWVVPLRLAGVITLIYGCCKREFRTIFRERRILLYVFIYSLVWLCTQASTIEERRKLGMYPLLFLIAVLFWRRMDRNEQKHVLLSAAGLFVGVQIVYLIKLLI